ncbi:MAG: hypothetical protein V7K98_04525 [Nostoc sp.]|uniref:hypothetical protein n=1 Tax=Nostoc sp. TaxID=1180 RepID=UPI002FF5AF91
MEHEKQNHSQELSIQELADISGGVNVGEYYPDGNLTDNIYNNVSEDIAKHLENTKLPYWKDKYNNSQNHKSNSSS